MTEQENAAIIGDEIEESEQGGNGAHNREVKRRRRLTPEGIIMIYYILKIM